MNVEFNPFTGKFDLVNRAAEECSYTVPANTTSNIDTIPSAVYKGIKYFISAEGDDTYRSMDMTVYKRGAKCPQPNFTSYPWRSCIQD